MFTRNRHPQSSNYRLTAVMLQIALLVTIVAGVSGAPLSNENKALASLAPDELELYQYVAGHVSAESFASIPWHMKKTLSAVAVRAATGELDGKLIPAYCFEGDMPQDVIAYLDTAYYGGDQTKFNEIFSRWLFTALPGTGFGQGDPAVVTYSYVPDGTNIPGDPDITDTETMTPMADGPSNLFAFLNGIYGSPAVWQAEFDQVFADWTSKTGITYVYEPNDDGAAFPESGVTSGAPGLSGVRGDVRIAGVRIDGQSGANILAFNFYPNAGDMLFDTSNTSFYGNTSGDSLRLRNVIAHEHGHGVGMPHTCPVNGTKLMEPNISLAFDGVQQDERLSGQRTYGDPNEKAGGNDSFGLATDLGPVTDSSASETAVSIDDDTDQDFYAFTTTIGSDVTVTLTPIGTTYLSGTQNGDGTCTAGSSFNALTVANLNVDLIATNGIITLATGAAAPAGSPEVISNFNLSSPGTYFVRVYQAVNTNNVQGYDITVAAATNVENYPSTDTPLVIPDASVIQSIITVPAAKTFDSITDVNVNIDISHANVEDLDVTLESPTGTVVELFTDVGGTGNDFTGTTLDDDGAISIAAGAAPFTGTFSPEGALSDVNGESAIGDWTLTITDDNAPTAGTLNSWSLDIAGTTTPPVLPSTSDWAQIALGAILAALVAAGALWRRRTVRA